MLKRFQKIILSILTALVLVVQVLGYAQPAHAQFYVQSNEIASIPDVVKSIWSQVTEALKIAALNAATTVVGYAIRKISYDAAVWIASGNKGQGALVYSKGFGDYLKDVADDAGGHAIDQISDDFELGNICRISDPKIDLGLRMNLRLQAGAAAQPKPRCTVTEFINNNLTEEAWLSRFNTLEKSISQQFNEALTFDISQGEVGIALETSRRVDLAVDTAVSAARDQRLEGEGVMPLVDPVSGRIKSPSSLVKEELAGISNRARVDQSGEQINTVISSGQWQLLPGAVANFFLNTLAGTMIKNFQEQGILPFGICVGGKGGPGCESSSGLAGSFDGAPGGQFSGRQAAQALFSDFLTVRITQIDQYDILSQLSSCPSLGESIYNCRADNGLVQAAQEAANGNPLTLKQAIDKGFLRGDWKLIPPDNSINTARDCFNRAYCHSNIKVLRQVRLLPLGFEIAAEKSSPDQPWTLSQIIDGFNDCDFIRDTNGRVTGVNYDPINKPLCHLVDPNWVIKSPATRCNANIYGSSLLSPEAPDRSQTCADLTTCVGYNKDGTCINYAYCTRESNVWKFDADKCDAQFRTCRTFTDAQGTPKSYLYRSLNTAYCNKDNVGCKAFSLDQDASGNWKSGTGVAGLNTTGIYFNSAVSLTCGANSAGCSAFKVANTPDALLYLRKAPEYLKCYDSNPATPEVDPPKTRADLLRIQARPECKNYANVCIQDEMNCNWYTPKTGGAPVPGRYDATTVCNAKCVGYAAYREMPNNYSNGQSLAYVIPSSGQKCSQSEEGCSAFTNLSTTSGGLEQVEYYSYLRPCVQPDPNIQKNFITYEGTVTGFQLKTYTLVKDASGGPKYFYRTGEDLSQYNAICNQALYKAGGASLDCREFNDESGNVYYRLLSKTIPVAAQCNPYRLTNAELYPTSLSQAECAVQKGYYNTATGQCNLCFQNGEYRDGSCFYYGLPAGQQNTAGNSVSCSAAVDTCHAYKGNAGNNIRELFVDNFDAATVPSEWKGAGLAISAESIRVGGKSLGFTGNGEFYRDVVVTPGKSEEVTFWAKGSAQTISISVRSADGRFSKDFGQVTVGDAWNQYRLGPIDLEGLATSSVRLVVKTGVVGRLYLDNVAIKEVSDYIYLVKKSLKVDAACDSNLNDNLPGEALGCTAYTDPANRTVNLTGFNYLCRENAIGCTALFDTHNTLDDAGARAYNVRLSGTSGATVSVTIGKDVYSCQIPGGENGCYVNIFGHEVSEIRAVPGVSIATSTVYIPSDTPSTTPLYLVANQSATCNAVDLGCRYAGVETQTPAGPKYQTTLVKNDPASYDKTLCQREAVGCQAYSGTDGTAYFKDPSITGNKICAYRTGVSISGIKSDGWFWKGVGTCSNDKTKYCSLNQDCGAGNTCVGIGNQPCYPTYVVGGNNYGLWSFGDGAKYENFVGECPAEQNMCTEFVDRSDNDRSYYLLKNNKVSAGSCDGKVSQREGCALFDQTDLPNKFYNSKATYDLSTSNQFAKVSPVPGTLTAPGDSNVIIQVKRDRECGEWLQCRSSHRVWDEKTARWKTVCDAIGRCNKTPENPQEDSISNCANWVEDDPASPSQILTPEQYVERDVSWAGRDYAGFSILNLFPIESLSQVNIAATSSRREDWRLVRALPCGGVNCANPAFPDEIRCQTSNAPCGRGSVGLCIGGTCMQGIDGANKDVLARARPQACRAYPEKDSPFPNSPFIQKAISQFSRANICNETASDSTDPAKAGACDCDYTKVTYGDVFTKFFAYNNPHSTEEVVKGGKGAGSVPEGICLGGSHDGRACANDNDCFKTSNGKPLGVEGNTESLDAAKNRIADGTCQKKKRDYKLLGWRGYCLEYDTSRNINGNVNEYPCLTWLPIDHLIGTADIDNQHTSAGYNPPAVTGGVGGSLYCLEANGPGGADESLSPKYPSNRIFETQLLQLNTNGDFTDTVDNNQNGRKEFKFPATSQLYNFTQMDIERIDFTIVNDRDAEDPILGATFSVWPNDKTRGKPQAVYTTKGHNRSPGTVVTGNYMGKDNEVIVMYGSTIKTPDKGAYVDTQGEVCYPGAWYKEIFDDWDADRSASRCQDVGGNIFSPRNGFSPLTSRGSVLGEGGLWDSSIPLSQICAGYSPKFPVATESYGGNWHAMRVVFDPITRKYQGIFGIYCDQSPGSGKISFKLTFHLRQWCRVVADTGSTITQAQSVAAWTNRLYQQSNYQLVVQDILTGVGGPKYVHGDDQAPFGSLSLNAFTAFVNSRDALLFTNRQQVKNCDFPCADPGFDKKVFTDSLLTEQPQDKTVLGAPYSCVGDQCVHKKASGAVNAPSAVVKSDRSVGEKYLNQLFARINQTFSYLVTPRGAGSDIPSGYLNLSFVPIDITETANPIPKPPLVFPVAECDSENKCLEDNTAVGFTINDRSKGDVSFFTSSARVFMKFFMLADHNQMPLRKVTVNWGDGYIYPLEGLYQNHRGYKQSICRIPTTGSSGTCEVSELDDESPCRADADCGANGVCVRVAPGSAFGKCLRTRSLGIACQSSTQCPRTETCQDSTIAKSFGKVKSQTCSSDYVQFDHVYQCYRGQPNNFFNTRAQCGGLMDECCVYQPKLQVKDNWGWCTGLCRGGAGGDGCYEKASGGECSSAESFIPFGGRIIVRPSAR